MNKKIIFNAIAYFLVTTSLTCLGSEVKRANLQLCQKVPMGTAGEQHLPLDRDLETSTRSYITPPKQTGGELICVLPADTTTHSPYFAWHNEGTNTYELLISTQDFSALEVKNIQKIFNDKQNGTLVVIKTNENDEEQTIYYKVTELTDERSLKQRTELDPIQNLRKAPLEQANKTESSSSSTNNPLIIGGVVIAALVAALYWRFSDKFPAMPNFAMPNFIGSLLVRVGLRS